MAAVTSVVRNGHGDELIEVPPETLDCGHPTAGNVASISYGSPDGDPDGQRLRTYRCRTCGTVTYSPLVWSPSGSA